MPDRGSLQLPPRASRMSLNDSVEGIMRVTAEGRESKDVSRHVRSKRSERQLAFLALDLLKERNERLLCPLSPYWKPVRAAIESVLKNRTRVCRSESGVG